MGVYLSVGNLDQLFWLRCNLDVFKSFFPYQRSYRGRAFNLYQLAICYSHSAGLTLRSAYLLALYDKLLNFAYLSINASHIRTSSNNILHFQSSNKKLTAWQVAKCLSRWTCIYHQSDSKQVWSYIVVYSDLSR